MPTENTDILAEVGHQTHETEYYSPIPKGYERGRHKYVVVMGTVMSGLGKGIFSSSLAKLLKDKGLRVAPIKMEGYLNLDSGTLNPYRHGEVFVLDDGMETDMDLGTYERMLDQNLTRDNFVTSGQIYRRILDKERQGGYLGRDVQMIPHVTGEVKHQLRQLAVKQDADVIFVEVGGTVGDFENGFYIEALRELAFEEGEHSVCFVGLTYIIEPRALGEQKSKAAQLGIKRMMELGVQPHIIACRGRNPVTEKVREKIAMFSNVPKRRVFSMHDRDSIYTIPEQMHGEGLDLEILSILDLHERVKPSTEDKARREWSRFVDLLSGPRKYEISVGITGKYAELRDAYASIEKSLEHCGAHLSANINIRWLDTIAMDTISADQVADQLKALDAVIVPGGFGHRGTEGKVASVKFCRETKTPYLGICLGFQMAVIEFARNVCGLAKAMSSEFDVRSDCAVIDILPEQKKIEGLGGNMRLGGKDIDITRGTLASMLYDNKTRIRERFRHRYEVDPKYIETLEKHGMIFSGRHPTQPIMQVLELPHDMHPYFIGGQFHPELSSRPLRPAPMFMGLVAAAIRHAYPDIPAEKISERWLPFANQPAGA
ncbi:MAG: CTP synthase [Planctomycetes bacterium]|nr:CTP synthase [Planctomycetota bacterium]